MSRTWLVVTLVGAGTIAIKSIGPVLLGGRPLPDGVSRVIELLAPALLGALVAVPLCTTLNIICCICAATCGVIGCL